jgi:hypothetical protein
MFIVLTEGAPPKDSLQDRISKALGIVFLEDIDKKVLSVKKCDGYELRTELWDMSGPNGGDPIEVTMAYTPSGDYIGEPKVAEMLCDKRGIRPEKSDPSHCVCSIGKSEKDGKWWAWSHRALFGFKIGDEVEEGDCIAGYLPIGFKAKTEADAKKMAIAFARSVS